MDVQNQKPKCPYCGNTTLDISANQGGYEKWHCRHCGYEVTIENDDIREKVYAMNAYRSEIFALVDKAFDNGKSEKLEAWRAAKPRIDKYTKQFGENSDDPLYAMAHVAFLTNGFTEYANADEKTRSEVEYKLAKKYLKAHPNASTLEKYVSIYEKTLRNVKRNKLIAIFSSIGGVVAVAAVAGVVILGQYSPIPTDTDSGIKVSVPKDAISMFDKFNVDISVEEQPSNATAYIDAKNALHSETEKFVLYDLSLTKGGKALDFDGSVTVEIPIPDGYNPSALKIYHVKSSDEFEEIPSTVSVANNTISFETTHFSLYAVAERHPIVTFDTNGAGEIDRQIIERDKPATEPKAPVKEGYTFAGWKCGDEKWNFSVNTVMKDITLIAQWVANEYTVTLVGNGGALTEDSIKVTYNETFASLPESLTKAGYTFLGWYTAESNGEQITSDSVLKAASDLTLYARFEKNVNKIVFNANGGEGDMSVFDMKTEESAKLPENTFVRTGYTFLGWSTGATGDVEYQDKSEYTMGTASSVTLYAVWQKNINTLSFDANGGDGSMNPVSMEYAAAQGLPANTLTRPGYTFIGWSESPTGNVAYRDKAEYTMGEKSEYVLYAQWQKNVNKIHFEANGGDGSMAYVEMKFGEYAHLPANTFTREGYVFIGWSDSPDGEVLYIDSAEYKMGADPDYTLYAIWRGTPNGFVFNANGGAGNMPSDFTVATGESGNLPANRFTKPGYTFAGWSTDEHGSVKFADGAEYTVSASGSVTLYAVWETVDYKIVYESNGGTVFDNVTYNIESADILLSEPEKAGYIFSGWYSDSSFKGEPVTLVSNGSIGDISLYAKWTTIEYTVTFVPLGGSEVDGIKFNIESADFGFAESTRDGYTFSGWFESADLTGEAAQNIANGTYRDITLYAKWELIDYTLSFVPNGADDIDSITYNIESADLTLPIPSRTGYTFSGWYTDEAFTSESVATVVSGSYGDVTFYAKWDIVEYKVTFDSANGEAVEEITFTVESDTFDLPETTRSGYTFAGWFDSKGNQCTQVEKSTAQDIALVARWIANTYSVKYDSNGGAGSMTNSTYTYDESSLLADCAYTRIGYDFVGWSTVRNGDKVYSNMEEILNLTAIDGATLTLYAVWDAVEYTVEYRNTMDAENKNPSSYTIADTPYIFENLSLTGYTFNGWLDSRGELVTEIAKGTTGRITLTASWTANTYTVQYNANGADGTMPDVTYTYGLSSVLSKNKYTKLGYVFKGWSTVKDGSVVYRDEQEILNLSAVSGATLTLYAKWEAVKYDIVYNGTAGVANKNPASYTIADTPYVFEDLERIGYTFNGWYDSEGNRVTSIPENTIGKITLTARWTAHTYKIRFDANGGTGSMSDMDLTYSDQNVETALTSNAFERAHYTFMGWATSPTGSVVYNNTVTVSNLTSTNEGVVILYAKWEPISYKITFDVKGGNAVSDVYYNIETETFSLPQATRTGYTFLGWYDNESYTGAAIDTISVGSFGYKTFYAKWEIKEYKIKLNLNDGNLESTATYPTTYNVESKDIVLPIPQKACYEFLGWYLNSSFSGSPISTITNGSTGDKMLYAKWKEISVEYKLSSNNTYTISVGKKYYFVGEEGKTYSNVNIVIAGDSNSTPIYIVLQNANITGDSSNGTVYSAGNNPIYVVSNGTKNSIRGGTGASAMNVSASNVYFQGQAELTLRGGDGSTGATGSSVKGSKAGTGGAGGAGGVALNAQQVSSSLSYLKLEGGVGGTGGEGGYASSSFTAGAGTGGDGGYGGTGGCAIQASKITATSGEIHLVGGNGGIGGAGGYGSGDNTTEKGRGGNGGNGGNGAKAYISCVLNGNITVQNGKGGSGGHLGYGTNVNGSYGSPGQDA